ncbi:MAG TPA: zf-HC2 domain-containing protein [Terriglobales bacterium]|nr:zf-HC2 domain-containing protein [Terriglobales bacterium]
MVFEPHPDANLLAAYCEGALPADARQLVLAHLAACAPCRSVASGVAAAVGLPPTPPTPFLAPRPLWASLAAACLALAAAGLGPGFWPGFSQRPPQPAAAAPSFARLAPAPPPRSLARPRRLHPPRPPLPAPHALALPAGSPSRPTVPLPSAGAEFRPSIDFSPLMTGFLDQPPLRTPRGQLTAELASWTGSPSDPSPNPPLGTPAVATPATLSTAASVWPYANGFSSGLNQLPPSGPMAPSIASGLGWAISRGGQVLRSIGAGMWAAVPLVPGVRFTALFSSNATIWAGGRANQLFFSSDHGAHWRRVRLPGLGPHPPALSGISFSDPLHGQVAAADGSAWTTADAGLSWTKQ